MKRIILSMGLIAMVVFASTGASAQAAAAAASAPQPEGGAHTHDGFFLRLGLNFGALIGKENVEVGGQEGPDIDYSGLTIGNDLLIGGSPVPGLAIGGALLVNQTRDPNVKQGNFDDSVDGTLLLVGIGAFADYYFDPHSGGHVQALLGFAAADFVRPSGANSSNDPTGLMLGIGGGYDFWIGDEWSVGPFARILYSPLSAEEAGVKDKVSYLNPSIGVAFTLH